jgi:hypothetical protein
MSANWQRPCGTGAVALASVEYEPRSPGTTVLYQIVRDHFETFRAQAAQLRDGEGLPAFVERAFRAFLQCGWLAGGLARFRCGACGLDRLVAFSCKGRALCPSCGGRRMAERAAHLVDHVLPDVPVRQWVLSLPHRLRYLLAWDHDLCRAVAAVLAQGVFRRLRDRACDAGLPNGRGGGVVVIQRFGGALNLNLHFHALILDGVFAPVDGAALRFHALDELTTLDVEEVLATIEPLIARRLRRRGLAGDGDDATDGWADDAPVFAELAAASIEGRSALGAGRGGRPTRIGRLPTWTVPRPPGHCHARSQGFSLHAALVIPAGQRERLERVCRYVLRPPVAVDRLHLTSDGHVRVSLREPWRDGTTDFVFDAVDLLGRLAVLVPRPRVNLILYYGILGARAGRRIEMVHRGNEDAAVAEQASVGGGTDTDGGIERADGRGWRWAALMRRTFGFDVLACPRCGGRLRLIALIEDAAVIGRILRHVSLPDTVPSPRPARAPPATKTVGRDDEFAFT